MRVAASNTSLENVFEIILRAYFQKSSIGKYCTGVNFGYILKFMKIVSRKIYTLKASTKTLPEVGQLINNERKKKNRTKLARQREGIIKTVKIRITLSAT